MVAMLTLAAVVGWAVLYRKRVLHSERDDDGS
jgi:hypothetical protein